MKFYYININSHRIAIISFIILFPIGTYLVNCIPNANIKIFDFILFASMLAGIVYLTMLLSRARIKIEFTEEGFRHIWVKKFILSQEKDIKIDWDQIVDYIFEEERGWDSFQLTLKDNNKYKIYRYTYFPQKDDFNKLAVQLPKYVKKINESKNIGIGEGKSIYQLKSFKWILLLLTASTILLLSIKLANPESAIQWTALGVIVAALLFYWMQIKNKK